MRVTNAPYGFAFNDTGDEDLDGFTFDAVDPRVVSVGTVKAKEGGSDTLALQLSGIPGVDADMLDQIMTRTNWQGRDARLWKALLDPQDPSRIISMWSYFTGYMAVPASAAAGPARPSRWRSRHIWRFRPGVESHVS